MKGVEVGWSHGITVSVKDTIISLDPQHVNPTSDAVFISHAHNDHVKGFESKHLKITTKETVELYKAKINNKPKNVKILPYGESVKINEIEIIPYNAGHILGSSQFQIRTPQCNVVYTGDINCLNTLTTEAAQITDCDILIMESTYGDPFYKFPEREETYNAIIRWSLRQVRENRIPVFQLYSAGKAQEIIALFNNFTNLPVIVDSPINETSRVYTDFGRHLVFLSDNESEGRDLIRKGGCIYIVSKNHKPNEIEKSYERAVVTGWALRFRFPNNAFPLSSHADYSQLINYVKTTKPSKVYTCFGFDGILAKRIEKECKITAMPLPPFEKSTLKKFISS
jgi:putative mRNA 3-end processing factor